MGVCNVFKIYCLLFDKQLGGNIYVIHISSIPKLSDNKLQFQVTWEYCICFAFSEEPELNQIAVVCGSLFYVFFLPCSFPNSCTHYFVNSNV